jgi:hypothetical protein
MFIFDKLCIGDCTTPTFPVKPFNHLGECVVTCPDGFQGHQGQGECLSECPDGFFAYETNNTCINKETCT